MKVDNSTTSSLAQSAYVMNILGGGMSMPNLQFEKHKDHYTYTVQLPGVEPDRYNVEIDHHNLFIYHVMDFDDQLEVPYMIKRIIIPAEVDYKNITADYVDGHLRVTLPFNELADGYHKDIEILKH
ncbi:MAG: Hsp20/alpha crystallin family protein [Cyclobacteriaceae bacterium]|nr:Hsp20/alpha crystallin family protein [Cyclobacteriaceae bacterium HetDA_MAG_MS6]